MEGNINQQQAAQTSVPTPQSSGGLKWLLIILVIVILCGGGYWYYKNFVQTPIKPSPTPSPSLSVTNHTVGGERTTVLVNGNLGYKVTVPKSYTVSGNANDNLLLADPKGGIADPGGIVISIQLKDSGAFDKSIEDNKNIYTNKGNGTYSADPSRNLDNKTFKQGTFNFIADGNYTTIYNEVKIDNNYFLTQLRLHQDMDSVKKEQGISTYQAILDSITI